MFGAGVEIAQLKHSFHCGGSLAAGVGIGCTGHGFTGRLLRLGLGGSLRGWVLIGYLYIGFSIPFGLSC